MAHRYALPGLLCFLLAAPLQAQFAPREAAMTKLEELKERQERHRPAQLGVLARVQAGAEADRQASAPCRIGTRTRYAYDGAAWVPESEHRFTYQYGQRASETRYRRDGASWLATHRDLYSYQNSRLAGMEAQESNDGGATWTPVRREIITYDGNRIAEWRRQIWSAAWVDTLRWRFIYDVEVLVRVEEDSWTGTEWKLDGRLLVTQVGNDLVLTEQARNGDWQNVSRITYHNMTVGQLIDPQFGFEAAEEGSALLIVRRVPMFTMEAWESGAWVFKNRLRRVIDTPNRVEYIYSDGWTSGQWAAEHRFAFYLDPGGRVQRAELQQVDGGGGSSAMAAAATEAWVTVLIEDCGYDAQDRPRTRRGFAHPRRPALLSPSRVPPRSKPTSRPKRYLGFARPRSSAGESVGFLNRRSQVRVLPRAPAPIQAAFHQIGRRPFPCLRAVYGLKPLRAGSRKIGFHRYLYRYLPRRED